eukprot:1158973-Pelagomonas_calceolata.AAC.13
MQFPTQKEGLCKDCAQKETCVWKYAASSAKGGAMRTLYAQREVRQLGKERYVWKRAASSTKGGAVQRLYAQEERHVRWVEKYQ